MHEETAEKPQILVVDDSRVIRSAAVKMLGDDYLVHAAVDGRDGWRQLQRNDAISVVFCDMHMPEMSGLELLARVRDSDDDRLAALPVIMITGVGDTESAKRDVFNAGATDFITKPFESIDLLSRARSYARLNRQVAELEKKAGHDELTGLLSAASLQEQGARALSFAVRHQLQIAAACLEIIGFRDIYLAHGKSAAQQIIAGVGERMKQVMRAEDIAARTGVARFALLLPLTSDRNACVVIRRIRKSIENLAFDTGHETIRVSLAAGYTSADIRHRPDFAEVMQEAESALRKALLLDQDGPICAFRDSVQNAQKDPEITGNDIRRAIEQILDGAYASVPDHMLRPVAEKLAPFLDYVAKRSDTGRTGTDDA